MGYDVTFFQKIKHPKKNTEYLIEVETDLNITSNIREMFYQATLERFYPMELNLLSFDRAMAVIVAAHYRLRTEDFRAYNSSNGWGTQEGLCAFLGDLIYEIHWKDIDEFYIDC